MRPSAILAVTVCGRSSWIARAAAPGGWATSTPVVPSTTAAISTSASTPRISPRTSARSAERLVAVVVGLVVGVGPDARIEVAVDGGLDVRVRHRVGDRHPGRTAVVQRRATTWRDRLPIAISARNRAILTSTSCPYVVTTSARQLPTPSQAW